MEERQENLLEFDDTFRFKDLPDTSTPHNATNMNKPLINTSYLKKYIEDIITGKVDLVVKSVKSRNLFEYKDLFNVSNAEKKGDLENGYWYKGNTSESSSAFAYSKGRLTLDYIFKANTEYYVSFDVEQVTQGHSNQIRIAGYLAEHQSNSIASPYINEPKRIQFKVNFDKDDRIIIDLSSNEVKITKIQIEFDVFTDYSPHQF